jgi:hypothetical protein
MAKNGICWMSGSCDGWFVTTERSNIEWGCCISRGDRTYDDECCDSVGAMCKGQIEHILERPFTHINPPPDTEPADEIC